MVLGMRGLGLLLLFLHCHGQAPVDSPLGRVAPDDGRCERDAEASLDAFAGRLTLPDGRVGASHNFSKQLALPLGTLTSKTQLLEGAWVYEAATVVELKRYNAETLSALSAQFRSNMRAMQNQRVVNRRGHGYTRAPFKMESAEVGSSPDLRAGLDEFVSYTKWQIETGWEEGAIVEGPSGFRFAPTKLYANVSYGMRMPHWEQERGAERERWVKFRCDLAQHEGLHLDTARAVVKNALVALSRTEAPSREQLEASYYGVWKQAIAWGNEEDRRIDDYTGHGPILSEY